MHDWQPGLVTHASPQSGYIWVPAARAREILRKCAVLAVLGFVACAGLTWAIVGFGRALPTAYHPINNMVWITGCASVFGLFLSSVSIGMARSYAWGEQFDVAGVWQVRRALAGGWVSAILFIPVSWFLLVMTVRNGGNRVGFTGGVWAYLLLLTTPAVVAGVLFFVGRAVLPALTAGPVRRTG